MALDDVQANIDTLLSLYCGDRVLFNQRLHERYVSHTPGSSQIAGTFAGLPAHHAHVDKLRSLCNGTFRVTLRGRILADEVHALVPTHVRAQRGERSLDMDAIGLYRFEQGWVMEHWVVPGDMAIFDSFWGQEQD